MVSVLEYSFLKNIHTVGPKPTGEIPYTLSWKEPSAKEGSCVTQETPCVRDAIGLGLWLISRCNSDWDLFGIDVSEYAADKAREALPTARIEISSIMNIPYEGYFDVITAFDVMEHLKDLNQAAISIVSKLTLNGSFIFVVPVYDGPFSPLIRNLDKDITHIQRESRKFWLEWVDRNFHLESWCGILRYLLPGGFYIHWPTRIFRHWTPAIAVIARRK